MARTNGHGNPDWTRDETILALRLYFECGESMPSKNDLRVQRLSTILRAFPYHAEAARKDTFRNPDGVAFKLHNLRSVATGKGFANTSKTDREIWQSFGSNPERVMELAALIEASVNLQEVEGFSSVADDAEEFFEGRILTLMHKRRERHAGVRKALLASHRRKNGLLCCDLCGVRSAAQGTIFEDAIFEAHHLLPLGLASTERKTRLGDMALVCGNCHRLIHRLIAHHKRWLDLPECRGILQGWRNSSAATIS